MPSLDPALRIELEKAVVKARERAEDAARAALSILAVNHPKAFETLTEEQRAHRSALRAKARRLAGGSQSAGFPMLVEEVAYARWHRMLFARFLAENNLLIHPEKRVAVTLEECEELAALEGDQDRWMTAARYAGDMLPGIFSPNELTVEVSFAPEGRASLDDVLDALPKPVFTSDDGLGWVYQFWQSKRKKEVGSSDRRIEKLDLAAYTQLFTEDYMVRFLLENTLGAWWAARHPESPLVRDFEHLRFRDDGTPAAGAFPGWPERAAEITVMDPCCGSGHFLVTAFDILRRMRMDEEDLNEAEAAVAVLRDNLFGLEIDPRCVQIAAFALAIAAWKVGGYRELAVPNVACSGIAVSGQFEGWIRLAGDDANMRHTLERLYGLFVNAPDLGSLINPADVPIHDRMFEPGLARVAISLEVALGSELDKDPVAIAFGEAAQGISRAARLLGREYTLVSTNVPYLGRGKQGEVLRDYSEIRFPEAKGDLATIFVQRCRELTQPGGGYAVVVPETLLFLKSFESFRSNLLRTQAWHMAISLGPGAFETISGEVVKPLLLLVSNEKPVADHSFLGLDVSDENSPATKASSIIRRDMVSSIQSMQVSQPGAKVNLTRGSYSGDYLSTSAYSTEGLSSGDGPRFLRYFWEVSRISPAWSLFQRGPETSRLYAGCKQIVLWENGEGVLAKSPQARIQGNAAWGKPGILVSRMGRIRGTLYLGGLFDKGCVVVTPRVLSDLPQLWAFCSNEEFETEVRSLDKKVGAATSSIVQVPFDVCRWRGVADSIGPLPQPSSEDPTEWLLEGHPSGSNAPLLVAVARLLGYQWPKQGPGSLSLLAVPDGILTLSSAVGQEPPSERLRTVLARAYGERWSAQRQTELLRHVGFADKGMDAWLRDGFFLQHCRLFHHRPFIWHIWDGRRDGFSVLVNYHKLDFANLNRLIYTYLGEWIHTQRAAQESGTPGADARLVAALELQRKLEAIRDGEEPYDIYVRWKPLHEQPIGWNPDLNDGVRLNIRPFVMAGVLRNQVKVRWNKDRGRNPDGSDRLNDLHYTLAERRAAQKAARA